jgi:hypothetical protein
MKKMKLIKRTQLQYFKLCNNNSKMVLIQMKKRKKRRMNKINKIRLLIKILVLLKIKNKLRRRMALRIRKMIKS